MKFWYWVMLKSGELRTQERVPKGKPYIRESIKQVSATEKNHLLEMFDRDTTHVPVEQRVMVSRCGYDRQVKLHDVVRTMLKVMSF